MSLQMSTYNSQQEQEKDTAASGSSFVFVPVSGQEASQGRGPANYLVRAHIARLRYSSTPQPLQQQPSNDCEVLHTENNTQQNGPRKELHVKEQPNTSKKRRRRANQVARDGLVSMATGHAGKPIVPDIPRLPAARRAGADRQDPFWTYPVEYEPYLPAIFAHYIENVAVEMNELDIGDQKGLLRRRFFPLAMEAPSTMYATLLMAASHYCAVSPPQATGQIDLLFLKTRALQEINKAMRHPDPCHALSDPVIAAVVKMAACEAVFGDPAVYKAHMKGLSLMIGKRGGLHNLGLDGFLERLVVWIDLNAAFIHQSNRTFGNDAFPTSADVDGPHPFHFTGMK